MPTQAAEPLRKDLERRIRKLASVVKLTSAEHSAARDWADAFNAQGFHFESQFRFRVRGRTPYGESVLRHAIRKLEGHVWVRRRLDDGEVVVVQGRQLVITRDVWAVIPAQPELVAANGEPKPQRSFGYDRNLHVVEAGAAVPGCTHQPRCRSRSQHTRREHPAYFSGGVA